MDQQRCPFLSLCRANCPTAGDQKIISLHWLYTPMTARAPWFFLLAQPRFEQQQRAQFCCPVCSGDAPALCGRSENRRRAGRAAFLLNGTLAPCVCCCRPPKPAHKYLSYPCFQSGSEAETGEGINATSGKV